MKYKGKTPSRSIEICVLPRQDGDIVFKCAAVLDYTDFDKLCPTPDVPVRIYPDKRRVEDVENPDYKQKMNDWATQKVAWMFIESLKATPELEWETVDPSDSETWVNYQTELKEANFTEPEISRILETISQACGLNQDKIDEATESFLVGMRDGLTEESSLSLDQKSMPNGEPVSDSE